MFAHLLKGLMVGLSIAAPVGPIGILCIRRTLLGGKRLGYISGLGAATAHLGYGLLSVCGLSLLSPFIFQHRFWFHLLGGLYLCCLGFQLARKRQLQQTTTGERSSLRKSYLTSLIITGTNPMSLVSFITLLTSIQPLEPHIDHLNKAFIILGIFLSSIIWWLFLCQLVHVLRHRVNKTSMLWLHRLSGATLTLLGLFLLIT